MNQERRQVIAAGLARMTKPALIDWLIAHGTIYPNRAGLAKWTKDDLVSSATDRVVADLERAQVAS